MTNTTSFPVLSGDVVTEAHVRICAERGHATHKVNGVADEHCPRCGEFTLGAETEAERILKARNAARKHEHFWRFDISEMWCMDEQTITDYCDEVDTDDGEYVCDDCKNTDDIRDATVRDGGLFCSDCI